MAGAIARCDERFIGVQGKARLLVTWYIFDFSMDCSDGRTDTFGFFLIKTYRVGIFINLSLL